MTGEAWIEHGDAALRTRFAMASRLEEPLDFLPRELIARGCPESDLEGEPILATRAEPHRRHDRLDLPRACSNRSPGRVSQRCLESGITVGEELQDRFLVLQHETPPSPRRSKPAALQLRDGGALRSGVGEDEPIAVLPHCGPPRRRDVYSFVP